MKILGIDPGTTRIGWGIIETKSVSPETSGYGCVNTEHLPTLELRLENIYDELKKIISEHTPDVVSIEDLFFSTNVKTALSVGHARGVILLTCTQAKIPVVSYTPNQVKLSMCGTGKAEKKQVQLMVKQTLHLSEIPKPDDTADALAIALTHAFSYKMKALTL